VFSMRPWSDSLHLSVLSLLCAWARY